MSQGIELRNVTKRYGSDARAPLVVKGISFEVPVGTLTTILGPSGCGKTTTLRMIAGLDAPTSGRILIDGHDVTTLGAAERNVSMVFQSYALFPHMDVLANVRYGLDVSGVSADEAVRRARSALESVGLVGFDRHALPLFDEPLSNLDARLRRSMREEIRALQQRLKLTVAYVTHDQSEALAVSDQIVVMDAGRIAQAGTPRELYEAPGSAFVAGFMGEALLFDAVAEADGTLVLGPLRVPARQPVAPGPVKLAVRPEAWRVGPAGPGTLQGALLKHAYLGALQELTVATPLGEVFVVSPDLARSWRVGEALGLTLAGPGVAVVAT